MHYLVQAPSLICLSWGFGLAGAVTILNSSLNMVDADMVLETTAFTLFTSTTQSFSHS